MFQSSNIPFLRLLTVRRRKMRIVGKYRFQQLVAECFCASVIEKQLRNDGLSVPLCCDDTIRLLLRGGCGFLFCHWQTSAPLSGNRSRSERNHHRSRKAPDQISYNLSIFSPHSLKLKYNINFSKSKAIIFISHLLQRASGPVLPF